MTGPGPDPRTARWTDLSGAAKGATYDARWAEMAAAGRSVHGEADLVADLLADAGAGSGLGATVLDAGCGTGRVAIELARRGAHAIGVDRDAELLATARAKPRGVDAARHRPRPAPDLTWHHADLVDLGRVVPAGSVDLAVLAGNVMIFVDPGTERAVLDAVAATVRPGGLVVAGFQVRPGGYGPRALDADADAAGLSLRHRWSTWERDPWSDGDDYQVSVHVVGPTSRG